MVRVTRSKIEESTKLRGELLYRARDTRLIIRRGKVYGKVFGILKYRANAANEI